MLLSQTLALAIYEKISKSHTRIINLNYQLRHGIDSLNHLMNHIQNQIFRIILNAS